MPLKRAEPQWVGVRGGGQVPSHHEHHRNRSAGGCEPHQTSRASSCCKQGTGQLGEN